MHNTIIGLKTYELNHGVGQGLSAEASSFIQPYIPEPVLRLSGFTSLCKLLDHPELKFF